MKQGYIHSIETFGALDGPGIRSVIFLQGCPLRCIFCHNVDSTIPKAGTLRDADELVQEVLKNKAYWESDNEQSERHTEKEKEKEKEKESKIKGGITISGGEPVFQPEFAQEIARQLQKNNVHTAIDTCLFTSQDVIKALFPYVDLWMVSIKGFDPALHKRLTGVSNEKIHENLRFLDDLISQSTSKEVSRQYTPQIRLRYIVIPSISDTKTEINNLIKLAQSIKNLEALELLPYTTIGRFKWIELFGKYELDNIPDAKQDDVNKIKTMITTNSPIHVIS